MTHDATDTIIIIATQDGYDYATNCAKEAKAHVKELRADGNNAWMHTVPQSCADAFEDALAYAMPDVAELTPATARRILAQVIDAHTATIVATDQAAVAQSIVELETITGTLPNFLDLSEVAPETYMQCGLIPISHNLAMALVVDTNCVQSLDTTGNPFVVITITAAAS